VGKSDVLEHKSGNVSEMRKDSEKVVCRSTKAAVSLKHVKIEEKLL